MDVLPDDPTYSTFFNEYLLPNRPVLICSSIVSGWTANVDWTSLVVDDSADSSSGARRESSTKLVELFGELEVRVAKQNVRSLPDHQNAEGSEFDWRNQIISQKFESIKFKEVVAGWKNKQQEAGDVLDQENKTIEDNLQHQVMYVKDWHLIRIWEKNDEEHHALEGRKKTPFYRVPDYCLDDWMNEFECFNYYYLAETDDDFRFVYMGERGTMTELHTDVYKSYSWSANVVGKKLWRLFSPETSEMLTIEQSPGQLIFVPGGWKHEVLNLSPVVISINHNWCNSVNLFLIYQALAQDIADVEKSITDVQSLLRKKWGKQSGSNPIAPEKATGLTWQHEWIQIVQELTKQHSGWNWISFWGMVRFITRRDFSHLSSSSPPNYSSAPSPPLEFVKDQISSCVKDFRTRDEFRFDLKLAAMIQEIEGLLSALE